MCVLKVKTTSCQATVKLFWFLYFVFIPQHNQWICLTAKRRAQDFPVEGFIASAQSQITQCLPSTGMFAQHRTKHENLHGKRDVDYLQVSLFFWKCVGVLVRTCFEFHVCSRSFCMFSQKPAVHVPAGLSLRRHVCPAASPLSLLVRESNALTV